MSGECVFILVEKLWRSSLVPVSFSVVVFAVARSVGMAYFPFVIIKLTILAKYDRSSLLEYS